jgi:hypothetical protein
MRLRRSALAAGVAAAILGSAAASAVFAGSSASTNTYTCTQVDVPGATSTSLWRLNNNNFIAANSTAGPYIYNPNTGVWTALPAPPASSGFVATDLAVFDINDQGTIVGAASDPNVNNGTEQGFILGSISNPASYSFYSYVDPANPANNNTEFRGVSNNGLITGWALSYSNGTAGAFVYNPTTAPVGSITPGFNTFDPVLSDGSTSLFTQLAGINASGLIAGSAASNTLGEEGLFVGPNSLSFVQVPNQTLSLELRGVNDGDPSSASNCDNGSCVRASGFGYVPQSGSSVAFYLDYDPQTHYAQAPQLIDCSGQIPASANTLIAEGINNSDTIAGDYSDAAGNSHGVIAYASTTMPAQSCSASEGGCNLSNGVIPHSVVGGPSTLPGTVSESTCKVPQDPRIVQFGSCTGHSLPVSQVCPGFGNTVIPDYLCGGAGPTGTGFELADTVAEGVDALSGIYVESEAFANVALGGTPPACPETVVGWAPRSASSVEGTVPEGNNMLELTSGCGSSKTGSRGLSIYAIGLTLNTAALPGRTQQEKLKLFAAAKYENLYRSIAAGNMEFAERIKVNACVAVSELLFATNNLCQAARAIVDCDAQVAANVGDFSGSPSDPNVWGDIRGRLGNLYLTINTRLAGNPPNTSWPPTNLPACR